MPSTTKAPKPSVLLARSLRLLGKNGERWIKGGWSVKPGAIHKHYNDDDSFTEKKYPEGAFCAVGALRRVNTVNQGEAERFLSLAVSIVEEGSLDSSLALGYDDVIEWNDRDERTFPQVRRMFERAIAIAKAAGR